MSDDNDHNIAVKDYYYTRPIQTSNTSFDFRRIFYPTTQLFGLFCRHARSSRICTLFSILWSFYRGPIFSILWSFCTALSTGVSRVPARAPPSRFGAFAPSFTADMYGVSTPVAASGFFAAFVPSSTVGMSGLLAPVPTFRYYGASAPWSNEDMYGGPTQRAKILILPLRLLLNSLGRAGFLRNRRS